MSYDEDYCCFKDLCVEAIRKGANMPSLKKRITGLLIEKAMAQGVQADEQGYVNSVKDNLITEFTTWDQIERELRGGDGNELGAKGGGKPKFYALHSSAALCVNNFAVFKEYPKEVNFLNEKLYRSERFEKRLPTGISNPNLDFFLESKETTIGIESKFLEILELHKPKNLDKYVDRKGEIDNIPQGLFELIQYYINIEYCGYLDIAQLIKHSIGLIRYSHDNRTKPKLVYIYWTPEDDSSLPSEFMHHKLEVDDFSDRILPFIEFIPMRYQDYWEEMALNKNCTKYIIQLMKKYQIPASSLIDG